MDTLVAGGVGVLLAVGTGKPGVEVKAAGEVPAPCVSAEAVYSPFKVANVSGVAEFAEMLQASWVMMINPKNRMAGDFFVDMVPPEFGFPKIKDESMR